MQLTCAIVQRRLIPWSDPESCPESIRPLPERQASVHRQAGAGIDHRREASYHESQVSPSLLPGAVARFNCTVSSIKGTVSFTMNKYARLFKDKDSDSLVVVDAEFWCDHALCSSEHLTDFRTTKTFSGNGNPKWTQFSRTKMFGACSGSVREIFSKRIRGRVGLGGQIYSIESLQGMIMDFKLLKPTIKEKG